MCSADLLGGRFFGGVSLLDGAVFVAAFFAAIELACDVGRHATQSHGDGFGLERVPAAAAAVQGAVKRSKTHEGARWEGMEAGEDVPFLADRSSKMRRPWVTSYGEAFGAAHQTTQKWQTGFKCLRASLSNLVPLNPYV